MDQYAIYFETVREGMMRRTGEPANGRTGERRAADAGPYSSKPAPRIAGRKIPSARRVFRLPITFTAY
jgi:hypothetical protein